MIEGLEPLAVFPRVLGSVETIFDITPVSDATLKYRTFQGQLKQVDSVTYPSSAGVMAKASSP